MRNSQFLFCVVLIVGCAQQEPPMEAPVDEINSLNIPNNILDCKHTLPSDYNPSANVQRLVFFLGDGMGFNHLAAASLLRSGQTGCLFMEALPHVSIIHTGAVNNRITDSAAGATAFFTGYKTNNGMCGVDADGITRVTLAELARSKGWNTGFVTIGKITNATPAALFTHTASRDSTAHIFRQILNFKPEIVSGDTRNLLPSQKKDLQELYGEQTENSLPWLYCTDTIVQEMQSIRSGTPVYNVNHKSLHLLVSEAISRLEAAGRPYLLLVEEDWIDSWSHDNYATLAAAHTLSLDSAVASATLMLADKPGALIVVTADHECGGLTLPGNINNMGENMHQAHFSTTEHSPEPVPFFAWGAQSQLFKGVMQNDSLGRLLLQIVADGADGNK